MSSPPTDGFAVGNEGVKGFCDQQVVVEHWNGKKWTRSNAPDQPFNDMLSGVASLSPKDAWAVGAWDPGGTARNKPLVEHWDGTSWTIVPASDTTNAVLTAVDGRAHGSRIGTEDETARPRAGAGRDAAAAIAEHWDGTVWRLVPLDNLGPGTGLHAVSMGTTTDVWAVGWFGGYAQTPVFEHFNGSRWHRVDAAPPPKGQGELLVVAAGPNGAFAVGDYRADPGNLRKARTLVQECCA